MIIIGIIVVIFIIFVLYKIFSNDDGLTPTQRKNRKNYVEQETWTGICPQCGKFHRDYRNQCKGYKE